MKTWLIGLALLFTVSCHLQAADLPGFLNYLDARPELVPTEDAYNHWMSQPSKAAEALIPGFVQYAADHQYRLAFTNLDGHGMMGISGSQPSPWILVNSALGAEAQLATLVHELGHMCHLKIATLQTENEIIAESVSLLVLTGVKDIDSPRYSAAYILHMIPAGTRNLLYQRRADLIQTCADDLRKALL